LGLKVKVDYLFKEISKELSQEGSEIKYELNG